MPADEELPHAMENAREENMDGSSIVGGMAVCTRAVCCMLTMHVEASIRPTSALREYAQCEQGHSTDSGNTQTTLASTRGPPTRSRRPEGRWAHITGHIKGDGKPHLSRSARSQWRWVSHTSSKHLACAMEHPETQADLHDGLLSSKITKIAHQVTVTAKGHSTVAQVAAEDFRASHSCATPFTTEVTSGTRLPVSYST